MTFHYSWYQTNNRDYVYRDLEWAREHGFNFSDYRFVLDGYVEGDTENDALENLYMIMNTDYDAHPGIRSMSMSDIVILSGGHSYYCDDFGWSRLSKKDIQ